MNMRNFETEIWTWPSLLNCLVICLIIIFWGSFNLFTVSAIKQGPMRAQISHPHHSLIQFIMQYFAIHTYKTKCQYICTNSCLYFTTILVWDEMRFCGGWVLVFIILCVCTSEIVVYSGISGFMDPLYYL